MRLGVRSGLVSAAIAFAVYWAWVGTVEGGGSWPAVAAVIFYLARAVVLVSCGAMLRRRVGRAWRRDRARAARMSLSAGSSMDADRRRARLGLAVLAGAFVSLTSLLLTLPVLGHPAGFAASGAIAALPVFVAMRRLAGAGRAMLLAGAVGLLLGAALRVIALAVWLVGGA